MTMLPTRRNEQNWLPDFFNDFFDNSWFEKTKATTPAINVIDTDTAYQLELAAPGMTKDDFKVSLDNDGNLCIEMEKKIEDGKEKKHGRYLRHEFSYSKFQQVIMLPEDADKEKIAAKVEHGVLNVEIPKLIKSNEPETHKLIEIK